MSNQFDWQIGEPEEETTERRRSNSARRVAGSLWFLVTAALITGVLIGSWQLGKRQLARSEHRLRQQIQTLLDLEHDAFLKGDGDLYFSLLTDDAAWHAAQLRPENMAAARAGFTVTRAQARDEFIWANLSWQAGNQLYQRIAFFQWDESQLRHAANDPEYWGSQKSQRQGWGDLIYTEAGEEWSASVAAFVAEAVTEICWRECPPGRLPFTLELTTDFRDTAAPNQLLIPSPRLLALAEDGRPAPLFWQMLQQRLEAYLQPAVIRFAVPPPRVNGGVNLTDYDRAADHFMAANPDITIELIRLDALPENLAMLATDFDGAAVAPTGAMLTSGLVHDLTDYVRTDPGFDQADFYEQIWQGAGWRDRTWFMPQAAAMPLIFFDAAAYRQANRPTPSLRWTWDEMAQDVAALVPDQAAAGDMAWGFLDISLNSLLSYAYNWNNQCAEAATVLCRSPLQAPHVAAALTWYSQMAGQVGLMPGLTDLSAYDRQLVFWNWQSSRRQAAIWVDYPVNYEHQLLLAPIGVVPFPGSDRFDGITPLWVQGSFISQRSERPLAVWRWLQFLSAQFPAPRLIPARPSVAAQRNFWSVLPRPLGEAMRTAFPFARPVTIEEQTYLRWEQVTAVVSGEETPIQAAQDRPPLRWFGQ